jgi:ADP-ribose pyrophosphatase YjhB (NUDIX family)
MPTFVEANNKFNYRVAGIAFYNNKILLHTTSEHDYWVLPGGRVEFNEASSQGIIRELKEELAVDVQVKRLSYVHELVIKKVDRNFHELCFYYLISIPQDHRILKLDSQFNGFEDDGKLMFKWFSFNELDAIELHPEFIKRDFHIIETTLYIKHELTTIGAAQNRDPAYDKELV